MKNKRKKGFGLIEMIVGIAIVSIGVVGTFSMISRFSYQSQVIKDSFVASSLAQEAIEIVKNIRDDNFLNDLDWNNGLMHCNNGCEVDYTSNSLTPWSDDGRYLYLANDGGYKYGNTGGDIETYYRRRITITQVEEGRAIEVIVNAYWEGSETKLVSKLYNWTSWSQE